MKNYKWKLEGLAKGVKPSRAAKELKRIENVHGKVTPEIIVNEASKVKNPLHTLFEWDDNKAAGQYRIQQARTILNNIQIEIISDGEPREISVYEVIKIGDGYKSIDTMTKEDIQFVKVSIINQLKSLRSKLELYSEFDKVLELINEAMEII